MSLKDDLDRYDRNWRYHEKARAELKSMSKPLYTDGAKILGIPDALQNEFFRKLDAWVEGAVNQLHARYRADLVGRAIAEAKYTLQQLEREPEPEPAVYLQEVPEWPKDP